MVKKTTIGILVGVLLLVTAGAIVYARAGAFIPGLMLDGMKARMIENLDLTPDQVDSIEAIIEEIKAEIPDMRENHQEIHEEFARQFVKDTFDQEAVKSALEEKVVELIAMTDFMIAKVSEFHEILTPEQREKLVQHMQEIKKNRTCGYGPGPRHGRCPWGR
jgi:Spy/CpxP family protein refolding chaperone